MDGRSPYTNFAASSPYSGGPSTPTRMAMGASVKGRDFLSESETKKDLLIYDLRKQVSELLRYKEQTSNLRSQLSLVEERDKIKDLETTGRVNDLVDRLRKLELDSTTLRTRLIQADEDREELIRNYRNQLVDLQGENATLRAETERKDIALQRLDYEIVMSAKSTNVLQQAASEKEQTQGQLIRQLQERVSELTLAKQQLEAQVSNFEKALENQRRDSKDKGDAIYALQKEKETAENNKLELLNTVNDLQSELNALEAKNVVLLAETRLVTDLKKELSVLPGLKSDIRQLESIRNELEDQLSVERGTNRILSEEKMRLIQLTEEMDMQIREYKQANEVLNDVNLDNLEKKNRIESLQRELDKFQSLTEEYRERYDRIQIENNQNKNNIKSLQDDLNANRSAFTFEINALERSLEAALAGIPPKSETENVLTNPITESVRSFASVLRTRINDTFREVSRMREQQKSLQSKSADTNARLSEVEQETESNKSSLLSIVRHLSEVDYSYGNVTLTPSKRRSEGLVVDKESQLGDIVYVLQDKVSRLVAVHNSLKDSLEDTQSKLTMTQETAEHDKASITTELTDKYEKLLTSTEKQLTEAKNEINQVLQENLQVKLENKKLALSATDSSNDLTHAKEDIEQLFYATQLLIRGLRPFRVRIRDLLVQKQYLTKQVSLLETAQKQIFDAVRNATKDETVKPVRHRTSFRVGGVVIVAANRLMRFLKKSSTGSTYRVGPNRVNLAPREITQNIRDIPSLPTPMTETAEAEGFLMLLNHFDPTTELEDRLYSRNLVYGLEMGRRNFAHYTETNFTSALTKERKEEQRYLLESAESIGKKVTNVDKDRQQLNRELFDIKSQLEIERSKAAEVEQDLTKAQSLAAYLDTRVQFLQEETLRCVPNETYENLKKTHDMLVLKSADDESYKNKLEKQYSTQLTVVAELNQTIRDLRAEVEDKSSKLKKIDGKITEKETEITNLKEFISRQVVEMENLEEQRKKAQQSALESQTETKMVSTEKKHFAQQISDLENELLVKRKRVVQLESIVVELEREKEDLESRIDKYQIELQSKEKELLRSNDLINALQEAHKKALDRSNHLNQQLDSLKQQNSALKREIEMTLEREASERRDRNEWMKTRLELLKQSDVNSSFRSTNTSRPGTAYQDEAYSPMKGGNSSYWKTLSPKSVNS